MHTFWLVSAIVGKAFVIFVFFVRFCNEILKANWFSNMPSLQKMYGSRWEAALIFLLLLYSFGKRLYQTVVQLMV